MRYLISILLLLCTSCIQIGSDPKPQQHYLLESTPSAASYSGKALNIEIELVNFPDYLDRLQIVTSNDEQRIIFFNSKRWAEPLQDNLTRIIRENFNLMLPGASITVTPWDSSENDAIKVKLLINKFHGEFNNQTKIDIRWVIDGGDSQTIKGHFIDRQPIGSSYQGLVFRLNNGINRLSKELAKELADL